MLVVLWIQDGRVNEAVYLKPNLTHFLSAHAYASPRSMYSTEREVKQTSVNENNAQFCGVDIC